MRPEGSGELFLRDGFCFAASYPDMARMDAPIMFGAVFGIPSRVKSSDDRPIAAGMRQRQQCLFLAPATERLYRVSQIDVFRSPFLPFGRTANDPQSLLSIETS